MKKVDLSIKIQKTGRVSRLKMGCAHWCHHGQCATGKDKDSAHRAKEKGEIVKY